MRMIKEAVYHTRKATISIIHRRLRPVTTAVATATVTATATTTTATVDLPNGTINDIVQNH